MGRVMELAGLTTAMNEMESAVLSSFKDREDLSPWARPVRRTGETRNYPWII